MNKLHPMEEKAEQGDVEAQLFLAAELGLGEGFEKDLNGSFYWYCNAARKGSVEAIWNLGVVLAEGLDGFEQNTPLGAKFIALAATSFHPSAMHYAIDNYKHDSELQKLLSAHDMKEIQAVLESECPSSFFQESVAPIDVAAEANLELTQPKVITR